MLAFGGSAESPASVKRKKAFHMEIPTLIRNYPETIELVND
jgi:hypothetical protein